MACKCGNKEKKLMEYLQPLDDILIQYKSEKKYFLGIFFSSDFFQTLFNNHYNFSKYKTWPVKKYF